MSYINFNVIPELKKLFQDKTVILHLSLTDKGQIKVDFSSNLNPKTLLFKKTSVLGEFPTIQNLRYFLRKSFNFRNPRPIMVKPRSNDCVDTYDLFHRWS